jgi:hypothetical protein
VITKVEKRAKLSQKTRMALSSQKQKSAQNQLRKKSGIVMTKAEKWAKSYRKLKWNHQLHFNKGYNKKKNAKVNTKTNAKLHLKTNMNMIKGIKECDLEHESGDIWKEE